MYNIMKPGILRRPYEVSGHCLGRICAMLDAMKQHTVLGNVPFWAALLLSDYPDSRRYVWRKLVLILRPVSNKTNPALTSRSCEVDLHDFWPGKATRCLGNREPAYDRSEPYGIRPKAFMRVDTSMRRLLSQQTLTQFLHTQIPLSIQTVVSPTAQEKGI